MCLFKKALSFTRRSLLSLGIGAILPTMSAGAAPWYVPLLSQIQMKTAPAPSSHPFGWVISGSAKPLLLTTLNLPEAFKRIDRFTFKAKIPAPLMALLSGKSRLKKGDVLEINHLQVSQKNLHIKIQGRLEMEDERDFSGQIDLEGTGVLAHVEALVQSGTIRQSVGTTLQLLLTGLSLSQGAEPEKGKKHTPERHKVERPLRLTFIAKDKMLWLAGIPVCPLDQLLTPPPSGKA